jgi:hypothetical protein
LDTWNASLVLTNPLKPQMLMLVQLYSWCYAIVADTVVVATVDIAAVDIAAVVVATADQE